MNDKGREILQYMFRHMSENYVKEFTVLELPNRGGISHLINKGYIAGKNFGSPHAKVNITTKGIDWLKTHTLEAALTPIVKSHVEEASIQDGVMTLQIHSDIYFHVKKYLDTKDYFHAVEEAYKFVRKKLRDITGKEQASEVFNMNAESTRHHLELFGKTAPGGTPESDFFRGVGYLNLSIQFLRNEKSHTLATTIDKNLAIHYISLASLAYSLITNGGKR